MFRYLGKGFLPGIPARDLTEDEAKQYGIKRIKTCGLYKLVKEHDSKLRSKKWQASEHYEKSS